jgi:antitoxin ParD1/3/4
MMAKTMTLNVRVNGPLCQFVAANVGDIGTYENVSEYVRDLIRKDKERVEGVAFERLKAELNVAFSAPDDTYARLTANEIIARNKARQSA